MQPMESFKIECHDETQVCVVGDQAKDCAAAEGDASPKAPDAVAVAIGLMEEYAEVFEELAK